MKTILTIILAFMMLGCGEDNMAHIGPETERELVDTNVTDDTKEYDTTRLSMAVLSSFSIADNGDLFACGLNDSGQLGLGDTVNRNSFEFTGVTKVKSVVSNGKNAFIIKEDGTLWGAGSNDLGQMGIGKQGNVNNPDLLIFTKIDIENVKMVVAGSRFTFIIKEDGTLLATGSNSQGQLGLGDNDGRTVFTNTGIDNAVMVSAGSGFSMVIKEDGTLWGAGSNNSGQLGLGDNTDRNVFTYVTISLVKVVSCGSAHSMIIFTEGALAGTGDNNSGQLGLGDNTDRNVFTATGETSVLNVDAGSLHTLIQKEDSSVFSTGDNNSGQLGLGDNTDRNVFTDTTETAIGIATGGASSFIIVTDTILSTGSNGWGELGLGGGGSVNTFTDTLQQTTPFIAENWTMHKTGDFVKKGDSRYTVSLNGTITPAIFATLTKIGATNEYKPFNGQNITPTISTSPMTYTIKGTEEFNAFTLAKVLADSVTYTFKNSVGAIIKGPTTVAIDTKRDKPGILSAYPTTVVYYADDQVEANGTVEITLTRASGNIELGQFTLNNMIDIGFSNLNFKSKPKDYNDYTPDEWGNTPESVKAVVTTFSGTLDITLDSLDYMVSLNESIAGKNVSIDFSDSNGAVADGISIFSSTTRRGRALFETNSVVKDDELYVMAKSKLTFTEVA